MGAKSAFRERPEIAAAVLVTRGLIGLHLDPFSASLRALASTRLFEIIHRCGGVFDLESAARHDRVCAVPLSAAGRGTAAVQRALRDRYSMTAEPARTLEASFDVSTDGELGSLPTVFGADVAALRIDVMIAARAGIVL